MWKGRVAVDDKYRQGKPEMRTGTGQTKMRSNNIEDSVMEQQLRYLIFSREIQVICDFSFQKKPWDVQTAPLHELWFHVRLRDW